MRPQRQQLWLWLTKNWNKGAGSFFSGFLDALRHWILDLWRTL
tara:strand:+ start:295 stop:423 length:129 start_codon:yes stop_codon:yes gene_type:complete